MDRDSALRKIRACLRLARSSNQNEAAAAMRQARKLMEEHGVSADQVDDAEVKVSAAKTRSRGGSVRDDVWHLASVVADYFRCSVVCYEARAITKILFFGYRSSPEIASYSFEILRRQLERDIARHVSRVRKPSVKRARSIVFGTSWVNGLWVQLGKPTLEDLDKQRLAAQANRILGGSVSSTQIAPPKETSERDRMLGYLAGKNAQVTRGIAGVAHRQLEQL